MRRLGSQVTVIEAQSILSREDPEMVSYVRDALISDGVTLKEGVSVTAVKPGPEAQLSDGSIITGSHLLIATGRAPNVDRLNLEAAQINYDRRGITVDASLKTTNKKVYAIGDVAGGFIAPLAFMRGRTFTNSYVIVDEAQNTTSVQMKMVLTRIGEGSRMVIKGELSQVDLPKGQMSG